MNRVTKRMKKNKEAFEAMRSEELMEEELARMIKSGKSYLDETIGEIGRMFVETMMIINREAVSGKDYRPINSDVQKWGFQKGSVYVGKQKVKVNHPRLRVGGQEIPLELYERLKRPDEFSEEMLANALRGLSGRKYKETIVELANGFGISGSSISKRVVEASGKKLKEFTGRKLKDFKIFAMFIDTVHRGGVAFTVALGIDIKGQKKALGLWEGATENTEVAKSLLSDLKSRGLELTKSVIFVTDGGGGIIRALKDLFGKDLIHQRCTIHKDRNIQGHLPKKYRREAHRRFRDAMDLKTYEDAKKSLQNFKQWLGEINESSVRSLEEAEEELLTLHRLKVPEILRKTLHSTNPIESMFSTVRSCEKNIKRYRGSKMSQRWLASVLLYAEGNFRTVKGYNEIPWVMQRIKMAQQTAQQGNVGQKTEMQLVGA